ncbi:putative methyltransferase type 11, S-adenosyl-L-methionine-dependent methyltransferase [Helianthus anomalus]
MAIPWLKPKLMFGLRNTYWTTNLPIHWFKNRITDQVGPTTGHKVLMPRRRLGRWHWQRSGCCLRNFQAYTKVIGTDTSKNQIEFAPKLPNVRYECTSPNMSMSELEAKIGPESSVDLVTVAQALHWFDHDAFYNQVKWILKKPHESKPYWESQRGLVDDKYTTVKFPFDLLDGCDHTGPFEFETKQPMSLDAFLTYVRLWSAYQTAKVNGVELLSEGVIEEFRKAWKEDANVEKSVTYLVYLQTRKAGDTVKQAI